VTVAAVTTVVRGLPTEVPLGDEHGFAHECVANCDNLFTLPKSSLGRWRGSLGPESLERLRAALLVALELD
jgi:mRNA interferase MazF